MIPIAVLDSMEAFLLSDRVTIKGSEHLALTNLVTAIRTERMCQQQQAAKDMSAMRVREVPPPDRPDRPAPDRAA